MAAPKRLRQIVPYPFKYMSLFNAKTKLDFVLNFGKYSKICNDLNKSFKRCFYDLNGLEIHLSLFYCPFSVKVEKD